MAVGCTPHHQPRAGNNGRSQTKDRLKLTLDWLKSLHPDHIDQLKFMDWFDKWSYARVPLLISLFFEILSPAKILSKVFQEEQIDVVKNCWLLENELMDSLLLSKTRDIMSCHLLNGLVKLKPLNMVSQIFTVSKNEIVELIEDAITVRLKRGQPVKMMTSFSTRKYKKRAKYLKSL